MLMLLIVIAAVLVLESVTAFCAPVFPSVTETQFTLVGDTETAARQSTPPNAQAAITPLAATPRHRIVEGAEPALKTALTTLSDRETPPRQEGTRVFMRPPNGDAIVRAKKGRLENRHRERLLRLVVRKGLARRAWCESHSVVSMHRHACYDAPQRTRVVASAVSPSQCDRSNCNRLNSD